MLCVREVWIWFSKLIEAGIDTILFPDYSVLELTDFACKLYISDTSNAAWLKDHPLRLLLL